MRGCVDPPALLIDPEPAQRSLHRGPLGAHRDRELAPRRARLRVCEKRRQRPRELAENLLQVLGGKPVVVVAEQALVHALAILGHALTVGACELDVARKRWRKGLEVVLRARLLPDLLAFGARAGALDHQLFGRAARAG